LSPYFCLLDLPIVSATTTITAIATIAISFHRMIMLQKDMADSLNYWLICMECASMDAS
jgi:hypothetical protein